MKRLAQFAISLTLAVVILYALLKHSDMQLTMRSVRQVRPDLLMLGFALYHDGLQKL